MALSSRLVDLMTILLAKPGKVLIAGTLKQLIECCLKH